MVEAIKSELARKLALEDLAEVNWEVTERLAKEPKYIEFNKWCDDNGVKHPSIRYPVAFGKEGQLVGIAATREIGFNEAYIYVPTKLAIHED